MIAMSPGCSRPARRLVRRSSARRRSRRRVASVRGRRSVASFMAAHVPSKVGSCRASPRHGGHDALAAPSSRARRTGGRPDRARVPRGPVRRGRVGEQFGGVRRRRGSVSVPASMRASSATRSAPSTTPTSLAGHRCVASRLVDDDVPVGEGRDLRQVGDDDHLWPSANGPAAARPRSPPVRPHRRRPRRTPSAGTGSVAGQHTSIASMTRDNSPPDAPRPSGRAGAPGARLQQELDLVDAVRPGPDGSRPSTTIRFGPLAVAGRGAHRDQRSRRRASPARSARRYRGRQSAAAAPRAGRDRRRPARGRGRRAASRIAASAAMRLVGHVDRPAGSAASSAQRSTPAMLRSGRRVLADQVAETRRGAPRPAEPVRIGVEPRRRMQRDRRRGPPSGRPSVTRAASASSSGSAPACCRASRRRDATAAWRRPRPAAPRSSASPSSASCASRAAARSASAWASRAPVRPAPRPRRARCGGVDLGHAVASRSASRRSSRPLGSIRSASAASAARHARKAAADSRRASDAGVAVQSWRCALGRTSRIWSDWPCTATGRSARSASTRDRGRRAADEGPRAAGGGDHPAQHAARPSPSSSPPASRRRAAPTSRARRRPSRSTGRRRSPGRPRCAPGPHRPGRRTAAAGRSPPWSCRRRSRRSRRSDRARAGARRRRSRRGRAIRSSSSTIEASAQLSRSSIRPRPGGPRSPARAAGTCRPAGRRSSGTEPDARSAPGAPRGARTRPRAATGSERRPSQLSTPGVSALTRSIVDHRARAPPRAAGRTARERRSARPAAPRRSARRSGRRRRTRRPSIRSGSRTACRRTRTAAAAGRRPTPRLEHPLPGALLDGRLVQRPVASQRPRRRASPRRRP